MNPCKAWGLVANQANTITGQTFTTQCAYIAVGQLSTMGYPNGVVLGYHWMVGLVRKVSVTAGGVTHDAATVTLYQPFGGAVLSDGSRSYTFDAAVRLAAVPGSRVRGQASGPGSGLACCPDALQGHRR